MLLRLVDEREPEATPEVQLELVRSLQLASRNSAWCSCGESGSCTHTPPGRGALLVRAVGLLRRLLDNEPNSLQARLRQAELLAVLRTPQVRRVLSPTGKDSLDIFNELLQEEPDSEELRRAYLRFALRYNRPGREVNLTRAAEYAQDLLAANPGDSEAILLFFAVRERYTSALRQAGKSVEAAKEGERTLGILSFLTSRTDFTQEIRERLIMLVAMHPAREEERTRREEELRTLLQNYDGNRIENLRRRLEYMRHEMEQRRNRMREPGSRLRLRRGRPGGINAKSAQPSAANFPAAQS